VKPRQAPAAPLLFEVKRLAGVSNRYANLVEKALRTLQEALPPNLLGVLKKHGLKVLIGPSFRKIEQYEERYMPLYPDPTYHPTKAELEEEV
jgi:hypothetical protein